MKRPNILYILQDHQAYYGHGVTGGQGPMRPNYEKFASEGCFFSSARCVSPMCGPARRCMLTGVYPHTSGQVFNENDPPFNTDVTLDRLYEEGYRNYYYGKWHAGPGDASDHHAEGFSMHSYGNPYITDVYRDYCRRKGIPEAVHHIEHSFMTESYIEQGYFPGFRDGADYQCRTSWCGEHATGITVTPKESHEAFFLASLACEKLEEIKSKNDGRPFSMQVHFWGPHQPFFPTKEFADLYNPDDITMPPSFYDTLENQPDVFRDELSIPLGENGMIKVPSVLPKKTWQEILARAYAHITMIDAAGGMILDKLDELGLRENTLVIWATDHGDALASHGGHFDKDSHMSEEVMRVPLAIRYPGVVPEGKVDSSFVFTPDTAVTMMDAAGIEMRNPVDGISLIDLANGKISPRSSLMCESYGHGYGKTVISRAVYSSDGWKYVVTAHDLEQLYNLNEDPYEMKNLAGKEEYGDKVRQMRLLLKENQKKTHDPVDLDTLLFTVKGART